MFKMVTVSNYRYVDAVYRLNTFSASLFGTKIANVTSILSDVTTKKSV